MARIFLTHADQMRRDYYGDEALGRLRQLGEVRLNETGRAPGANELIGLAQGCEVIVSDRMTEGSAAIFARLPELVAFVRCAVDIRNIDVGAASAQGILVTRASPGFVDSVAELTVGFMVDLARGLTDATLAYRTGAAPAVRMGRQLRGSTLGIIGYGHIGTRLAQLGLALGMRILINDPFVRVVEPELRQADLGTLLVEADFVVVLAPATEETEKLIGPDELGWMKPGAFLINVSRGNLDRRGRPRGGASRAPARGRCHGRRPGAGPDALARARSPAERARDPAHRRSRARGDRPSGARDHPPGRGDPSRAGASRRRQSGTRDAAGASAQGMS